MLSRCKCQFSFLSGALDEVADSIGTQELRRYLQARTGGALPAGARGKVHRYDLRCDGPKPARRKSIFGVQAVKHNLLAVGRPFRRACHFAFGRQLAQTRAIRLDHIDAGRLYVFPSGPRKFVSDVYKRQSSECLCPELRGDGPNGFAGRGFQFDFA